MSTLKTDLAYDSDAERGQFSRSIIPKMKAMFRSRRITGMTEADFPGPFIVTQIEPNVACFGQCNDLKGARDVVDSGRDVGLMKKGNIGTYYDGKFMIIEEIGVQDV
jgi:hypothetical protein